MIAALVLLSGAAVSSGSGSLERALELLKRGDARSALSAAESEPDGRARAEALVAVLHQAGDLEAALAAAQTASDAFPDDAWLAQKWAWIAATLRRTDASAKAASRLDEAVARLPESARSAWADAARTAGSDADELIAARARRRSAERVARLVSLAVLAGACAGMAVLALWPARRQRMSSTPVDPIGSNKVEGGSQ